ncbi:hypothetical protein GWI33_018582 [Rhynchophorus ferrugineus]|uniref:RRM domain-containing protein n=1 Tax=Rhynchophorus ferrugineus TaxID=354439 RepID=A0A834M2E4_RHYFE|nr:hypothetical protein GWI33_018582 [Rhynchophorus ferrugineus]
MSSRIYIGRIPRETRERDLVSFFQGFGRIRDILIKSRYSFVDFDDCRDAEEAVHELHGKILLGMRVEVEKTRERPRGRAERMVNDRCHRHQQDPLDKSNYSVSVKNLPTDVSWQDLNDYVRPAGELTLADAHKKYRNGDIVAFATYEDMKNAIHLFEDKIIRRSRSKGRRKTINSRSSISGSRSHYLPRKDEKSGDHSRDHSNESSHEFEERERSRYRNTSVFRAKSNSVE